MESSTDDSALRAGTDESAQMAADNPISSISSQEELAAAAAEEMLSKVARYVAGEAELSLEDYRLLQSMNIAAADRYGAMADYSAGLVAFAERLQAKYEDMLPQLAQVWPALSGFLLVLMTSALRPLSLLPSRCRTAAEPLLGRCYTAAQPLPTCSLLTC
jgi:hypothetical protein